ncbi:MAG: bifunctional folylpolyglutamate synthase/dihydrofolate synthase [Thalassobaculaceae bacterium]|nr:bifunctional folylpolyglutamate synthase/dihydrofolate synthase [Thalassobaculaceae bacterium]
MAITAPSSIPSAAAGTPAPDAILARLQTLHPKAIDLSLDRVQTLLERLGNPERAVPPVIHVAGTNGKGSVIAYLRAILEAAGHRVHVYTSPHLVRFNERIRLAGEVIDDALFSEVLEECERINGGAPITLFEITTAAAFLAFSRVPADVLLLEVGLGGRFDTTNVIDRPLACVITPVSIDHVAFLGDTIEKIAFEKAGIIKPGVPLTVGPQGPAALKVIADRASALGAPMRVYGRDYVARRDGDGMTVETEEGVEALPLPSLPGAHQVDNAAVAAAVARSVAGTLANTAEHRQRGVRTASWPARMQRLTQGPLVAMLPAGWTLWLDGGHNADAGRAISAELAAWRRDRPDEPVHLIVGMLNTKAADDYLRPFAGLPASVSTVTIPGETASLSAEAVAAMASTAGVAAAARDSVATALAQVIAAGDAKGRVLIAGSLYLAGRVLAENG